MYLPDCACKTKICSELLRSKWRWTEWCCQWRLEKELAPPHFLLGVDTNMVMKVQELGGQDDTRFLRMLPGSQEEGRFIGAGPRDPILWHLTSYKKVLIYQTGQKCFFGIFRMNMCHFSPSPRNLNPSQWQNEGKGEGGRERDHRRKRESVSRRDARGWEMESPTLHCACDIQSRRGTQTGCWQSADCFGCFCSPVMEAAKVLRASNPNSVLQMKLGVWETAGRNSSVPSGASGRLQSSCQEGGRQANYRGHVCVNKNKMILSK